MSASSDPVQAAIDILDSSDTVDWTYQKPRVRAMWNVTEQNRRNYNNPAVYVWSPVETTIEDFDAERSARITDETVEISIWLPTDSSGRPASRIIEYAGDIQELFDPYARDNQENTEFQELNPDSINDLRSESSARKTNHHVVNVQISAQLFRETS